MRACVGVQAGSAEAAQGAKGRKWVLHMGRPTADKVLPKDECTRPLRAACLTGVASPLGSAAGQPCWSVAFWRSSSCPPPEPVLPFMLTLAHVFIRLLHQLHNGVVVHARQVMPVICGAQMVSKLWSARARQASSGRRVAAAC